MIFVPPPSWDDGPPSEFVYHLALTGEYAVLYDEHVQVWGGKNCRECGQDYPCNWRGIADKAHTVRLEQP